MKRETASTVATLFIATVTVGLGYAVTRPVGDAQTPPECWARLNAHGDVVETFGDMRCGWQEPAPPVVHFNYAPLTDEQRQAYVQK